jgi:hypothetical protein
MVRHLDDLDAFCGVINGLPQWSMNTSKDRESTSTVFGLELACSLNFMSHRCMRKSIN